MLEAFRQIGNSFIGIDASSLEFIKQLFWILISTKLLSNLSRKLKMPSVLGAILAGIIIGPLLLNLVTLNSFLQSLSVLGAIIIMFTAGMETNIKDLKKCGKESFLVAVGGVLFPLVLGTLVTMIYFHGFNFNNINRLDFFKYLFIGVILTATSVSITVETLKELGKLKTEVGNVILGAAIIDDIIGIIVLSLVIALAGGNISVPIVLIKVSLFILLSLIVGRYLNQLLNKWMNKNNNSNTFRRTYVIIAFVICLAFSYISEEFFGVAYITGAYIAGLIFSNNLKKEELDTRFSKLSYMLLSPIFFASIGLEMESIAMDKKLIVFTILIIITAIISKIVGCFLGSKIVKRNSMDAFRISLGMINRGEVALIIASKGVSEGLLDSNYIVTIVLTIIITTIITPIFLKLSFNDKDNNNDNNRDINLDNMGTV